MLKIMRTPSRYVQGEDAISEIKEHVENLGDSFLIIASKTAMKVTKNKIKESFQDSNADLKFELFNGQCTMSEINRLKKIVEENNIEVIVGVSGGQTLDTAKSVAYYEDLPVVICPTVAATDAPCTALSVIYTDEGDFDNYLFFPTNPDVVIVDTTILVNAPIRFLTAGMGDALGTYFETRECYKNNADNLVSGKVSEAGFTLAKLCYQRLLSDGYKAKMSAETRVVTEALENAIEATTYLSGVGAENGGLAAAHSIYNGFTNLPQSENFMHGEMVAFGTLVQLILENSDLEEIEEVINFCLSVGLPVTLKQMGLEDLTDEEIMKAASASCVEGETIHNMTTPMTAKKVYNAILAADKLGSQYLK
ncbi:glycerol dehydrogenase [Halanaerobaculum tunisiense]